MRRLLLMVVGSRVRFSAGRVVADLVERLPDPA